MSSPKPRRLAPPPSERPSYEVGYKKPPKDRQFQPEKSGNPKGRPKGARNKREPDDERLRRIIREEAYREITVNDGKRELRIPVVRAAIRTMGLNAAKGQIRALQLLTQLVKETEAAARKSRQDYLETVIGYKISWEQELDRRTRFGESGPEPIPHPDDIHINLRTGEVTFTGPLTKEEVKEFEDLRGKIRDCDLAAEYCQTELDRGIRGKRKELLINALEDLLKLRTAMVSLVGEQPRAVQFSIL